MTTRRSFLLQTAAATLAATSTPSSHAEPKHASTRVASRSTKATPRLSDAIRLAIVGTGQISHRYLKQAAVSTRARFVATCARTLDSAKSRAVEYGIPAWFDDYERMLDRVRPDGVVIATPTVAHAPQTIAALKRGIHVLCEKPMATTLDECRAMVSASQQSGRILLSLPFDANAQMYAAISQLNEPTLGVFTGAEAQLLLPGVSRDNWYYDKKVAGGGAGLDTLVYPVSRLVTLLGPARRVNAFINILIPHRLLGNGETIDALPPSRSSTKSVETTVDDNATLVIEWPSGQQALARALWGTSIVRNDTTIYGRHGTLWLSGGDLIIHSPERKLAEATPTSWNGYTDCYRIPYSTAQKTEGLVEHFVDCMTGAAQPTCGGEQQLHVHEILFKGYDAARTGLAQELETTFKPWHAIDPAFQDTRNRRV